MTRIFTFAPVFFLCLALQGCGAFSKGGKPTSDAVLSSTDPVAGSAAAARLTAARQVLHNRCASCHSHDHAYFDSYSEGQWIQAGLVKAKNSAGSALIGYIRGSGVSGPGTMPAEGGDILSSEIAVLKEWVDRIGEAEPGTGSGGGPAGPTAAQRSNAALTIIKNNCAGCHSGAQTATSLPYSGAQVPAFATFAQDVEFSTGGMVEYGLPTNSWLIRALRGTGDLDRMPPAGPLSASDRQTLVDWVTQLGQP